MCVLKNPLRPEKMHSFGLLLTFVSALCCCVATADRDCPEGKTWNECGSACPLTCDNYRDPPGCIAVCVPGCFCPEGKVESGENCVQPQDCPEPPSDPGVECPEGRVWDNCGTACPLTCDNYHDPPMCTRQCIPGCFCPSGTVVDREGSCVHPSRCPDPRVPCPPGRVWDKCGSPCPATCDNYQDPPICTCVPGCFCPPDTVMDHEGHCIPASQCREDSSSHEEL